MGNKRYSNNEKRFISKSNNNIYALDNVNINRNNAISGYKKFLILILLFSFICCFRTYAIERVFVSGRSMETSYFDEDVVFVRKFNISKLKRYQVVVAKVQEKFVIKRIIGLPNETIYINKGTVYINEVKLDDDYGYITKVYGCASNKVLLGKNEYFLMGDNRDKSLDSRVWGAVKKEDIKGVVFFKLFPFW